jgi:TRAP-type C4-dicarboxylate transport system permease small subunit
MTEPAAGAATPSRLRLRAAMDALYRLCVALGGTALVLISAVIPWAVYTRYELNQAASWPEPLALLLTVVLTFFGAAACYRRGAHMRVSVLVDLLPPGPRRVADLAAELLVALMAVLMVVWGARLVLVTWHNSTADFPFLSVGVTYLPVPLGGLCLLLFAVERVLIGPPAAAPAREAAAE